MPLPALYPLPPNPTLGQSSAGAIGSRGVSSVLPATAAGGGGVNREVLKGLQDVAWSDDEDDPDCLLCAEPLDLSDLNFKPCQCGMQICQFCYNKLLQSDARCPGCRRTYDAKAVIFQPVDFEEVKRAKEKKTKRARIIKQLDAMGRRQLLGVRIVMKNMVYVVGMKLPAPGDEAIPILRSNDYFGQYGKIAKLYLRDRTATSSTSVTTLTPDNPSTSTGIYIVYVRREDAARAISSLDGIQAPSGPPGQILKASYGTTRYCDAFLRSQKCDTTNCHNLHEWGGEGDAFTKNDLETALTKPQEYDARQKQVQMQPPALTQKAAWPKPSAEESTEAPALPRTASWGVRPAPNAKATPARPTATPIGAARPLKITSNLIPLGKNNAAFPLPSPSPVPAPIVKEEKKKKTAASTAMSRGRSGSSTQSTAPSSSAPASPKKKPSALPPITSAKSSISPEPAPPIESPIQESHPSAPKLETEEEPQAGPSTLPQPTPSHYEEPYPIHSPYPEFVDVFQRTPPEDDPGLVMQLAIDQKDVERYLAEPQYNRFSPFDRVFEELSELGVSAAEALKVPLLTTREFPPYIGMFDPFSASSPVDVDSATTSDNQSGSARIEEEESNIPRTASRFDFARRTSVSTTGRGQSPFNARIPADDLNQGWLSRNQAQGHFGEDLRQGDRLAPQSTGFAGSLGSSVENGWGGDYSPSYNRQAPAYQYGNDRERDRRQEQMAHLKSRNAEREEFDPALTMLQYGSNQSHFPPQPQQRMLFSPDGPVPVQTHQDEAYRYNQFSSQPQHTPSPHAHQATEHMTARMLQQLHQRAASPSPMSNSHAYRRF